MYFVDKSDKPFPTDLLVESVTVFPTRGAPKQRLLVMGALAYISQMEDGHRMDTKSYWVEVHRRGDFTSQELTTPWFHLRVMDVGDSTHYRWLGR